MTELTAVKITMDSGILAGACAVPSTRAILVIPQSRTYFPHCALFVAVTNSAAVSSISLLCRRRRRTWLVCARSPPRDGLLAEHHHRNLPMQLRKLSLATPPVIVIMMFISSIAMKRLQTTNWRLSELIQSFCNGKKAQSRNDQQYI